MGFKLTGAFRCGACGKPRGLGAHLCSPGKRKRQRTTVRNPVSWECGRCHQPRGVTHTCRAASDFRARRRQAETDSRRRKKQAATAARVARRKQVAADRRARDRARKQAAKAKRKSRPARPAGDSHPPGSCGDRACPKYGCKAYWQGVTDALSLLEGE